MNEDHANPLNGVLTLENHSQHCLLFSILQACSYRAAPQMDPLVVLASGLDSVFPNFSSFQESKIMIYFLFSYLCFLFWYKLYEVREFTFYWVSSSQDSA